MVPSGLMSRHAYSLRCNSSLELPYRILNIRLVKPKEGTAMHTIGRFVKLKTH